MPNSPRSAVAPASVRRAPHWAAASPLAAALSARTPPLLRRRGINPAPPSVRISDSQKPEPAPPFPGLSSGFSCAGATLRHAPHPSRRGSTPAGRTQLSIFHFRVSSSQLSNSSFSLPAPEMQFSSLGTRIRALQALDPQLPNSTISGLRARGLDARHATRDHARGRVRLIRG